MTIILSHTIKGCLVDVNIVLTERLALFLFGWVEEFLPAAGDMKGF